MGLYDFTDSRDPDRILNRLKRLEGTVSRLKGGVVVPPPPTPRTRLAALQAGMVARAAPRGK